MPGVQHALVSFPRTCFGYACLLEDHETPKHHRDRDGTTETPACQSHPVGDWTPNSNFDHSQFQPIQTNPKYLKSARVSCRCAVVCLTLYCVARTKEIQARSGQVFRLRRRRPTPNEAD